MRIAIVGCTHAGVAAIKAIKAFHPEAEVVVYERDDNVSFLSCGIALYLSGEVNKLEDMFYETPEHLASLGVSVKTRHDVLAIDAKAQTLKVQDLKSNSVFSDHYDKLIVTTGSYVQVPPIYGIDDARVMMCKDARQAELIRKNTNAGQHIAIVGAGYIGVELAEAFAATDHQVTLLQGNAQLLNNYIDPEMSARIQHQLEAHGVAVKLNARVESFEGTEDGGVSVATGDEDFHADVAIVCTGFLANTALLQGQVSMDRHGALLTNQWMQTSDENIYAAGDACAVHFNPTGKAAYVPLASNAVRQGYIVGRNVFGNVQKDLGTQATTAMRLFDLNLATTGLTLVGAKKEELPAAAVTYVGPYRPAFMGTHEEIRITLVYSTEDRRVLGAQLLSQHEITQSANAVSIAIQNHNTIDDLAFVDMLFNPHYDQPFNYLNLAAQMAVAQADKAEQEGKKTAPVVYNNMAKLLNANLAPKTPQTAFNMMRDSRPIEVKGLTAKQAMYTYPLHRIDAAEKKVYFDYLAPSPTAEDGELARAKALAGTDPDEDKTDWGSIMRGALFGWWLTK